MPRFDTDHYPLQCAKFRNYEPYFDSFFHLNGVVHKLARGEVHLVLVLSANVITYLLNVRVFFAGPSGRAV